MIKAQSLMHLAVSMPVRLIADLMRIPCRGLIAPVAVLTLSLFTNAFSAMVEVDDFQDGFASLPNSSVDGENGWTCTSTSIGLLEDPADVPNTVIQVLGSSNAEPNYKAIPTIADGTTGTLFFRFRVPTGTDGDINILLNEDGSAYDTSGGQDACLRLDGGIFYYNDGSTWQTIIGALTRDQWYKVWVVAHAPNDDQMDVYVDDGGGQVKLLNDGAFRSPAGDLHAFALVLNGAHDAADDIVFIDDIYVDPSSENLSDPTIGPPRVDYANGPGSSGPNLATLNGRVVSTNGAPLDAVRIYFGDSNGGTNNPTSWDTNFVFASVNQGETFSTNITDLFYGDTYYYVVYASNTYGEAWTTVTNFTTGLPAWTPAQISGNVKAWFDAADASTIHTNDAVGRVSKWDDKSVNGKHATQGNTARQPTYQASDSMVGGLPSIGSSTSAGYIGLVTPSLTAKTAYFVTYNKTGVESPFPVYETLMSGNVSGDRQRIMGNNGTANFINTFHFNDTGTYRDGSTSSSLNALPMPASVFKFKSSADRTQTYAIGFNQGTSGRTWHGYYSECVLTDGSEGAGAEKKIEGYLAWKWGQEGRLAAGHTYESDAPRLPVESVFAITNSFATNITTSAADLVGALDATQSVFTVFIYWSTSNNADEAAWLSDNTASNSVEGIYTNVVGLALTNSISNLLSGTTYYYTFAASNAATTIWASPNKAFDTPAGVGDIVIENAAADSITATSARLNGVLSAADTNADVIVYWWPTGGSTNDSGVFGSWTNVSSSNISYTVSGVLMPDTEYNFTFRATNSADDIVASPALSFTTSLSSAQSPAFTSVTPLTSGDIELDWQDNAANETGYILQRSTSEGSGYSTIASLGPGTTTYTDSGLVFRTDYYYQLAATNSANGGSATPFSACRTNARVLATAVITNTVTLDVVADTYIVSNDANANRNNDPEDELIVGYAGGIQRTLIRFDTSSIAVPAGTVVGVSSAVLKVRNRSGADGSGNPDVGVYDYAFDFGETTATWNNPAGDGSDSTDGGAVGELLASQANLNDTRDVSHTFATSSAFQSVVETSLAGDNTINLLLKRPDDTGTSNDYIRFRDRDYASGHFTLEVTYTLSLRPSATMFMFR